MSQVAQSEMIPMTYERWQQLRPSGFKRRCGVHRQTFYQMASVLRPHLDRQGKRGGPCTLSLKDQRPVALESWRDYRSPFHIAERWGISESTLCRLVQKVEALLLQSGRFCSTSERQHNRLLAQVRAKVEHGIRRLKIFRSLAEPYRNRRKRFGLRLNLIAAILNCELALRA